MRLIVNPALCCATDQAEAAERGRAEVRVLREQLTAATAQEQALQEQMQGKQFDCVFRNSCNKQEVLALFAMLMEV